VTLKTLLLFVTVAKVSPLSRPHGPRGGVEVYLYSFMTSALDGGGLSTSRPGTVAILTQNQYLVNCRNRNAVGNSTHKV